jgi:hypothetical protein
VSTPFPWRRYLGYGALILLLSVFPLLSVLVTSAIASIGGCQVNEAFVQPCVILGIDLGGLLYGMGVLGWLMLVTLPAGAIALAALVVMLALHLLAWRRNR